MPTINFKVTADAGIQGYWIAVDDEDLSLTNGQGQTNLSAGEHVLTWWMKGNEGKGISIVGKKASGEEVVKVGKSIIPPGRSQAAGFKRFTV